MKNKGFTLIELLATIVILAVIALITMPTIVGVVEKTRRNAAKESALMYKKMITDSIALDSINSKVHTSGIYQVDEKNSTIYNSSEDKIKVYGKGELPSEGYVCLDEKMSVGNYSLKIGDYVVIKTNDEVDVKKEEQLDMIRCYVPEVTINVEDIDKWTQSKTVTLNQSSTNKVKLTYKIVYQDGTIEDWKEYKESFTLKKPGIIYTKLENAINVISRSTRTITKIDTEAPTCNGQHGGKTNWTTNQNVTVGVYCSDTQSQCVKDDYTTTISGQGTTETATFTIADTAGNTATCGAYTYNKYIDTTKPTIGSATGSTATANSGTITVSTIADTGGSGLSGIYISTSSTAPTTSSSWTANTAATYTKSVSANGTYYIWVRDTAGNISDVKTATVSGIVAKVTTATLGGATVVVGNTATPSLSYSGTAKSVTYASSNTGIFTVAANRVVTGKAAGSATLTATITNYDGTTVVKTSTITVQAAIAHASQTGLNYNSIQAAINATSNGTVKLLVNRTESPTIAAGKTVILNLNGKTLTTTGIINRGTATINGSGTVNNNSDTGHAVYNYGTITISNGTYNSSGQHGTVVNNTGKMIINGGTIKHNGTANKIEAVYNYANQTLIINGGTIQSAADDAGVDSKGIVHVSGNASSPKLIGGKYGIYIGDSDGSVAAKFYMCGGYYKGATADVKINKGSKIIVKDNMTAGTHYKWANDKKTNEGTSSGGATCKTS